MIDVVNEADATKEKTLFAPQEPADKTEFFLSLRQLDVFTITMCHE